MSVDDVRPHIDSPIESEEFYLGERSSDLTLLEAGLRRSGERKRLEQFGLEVASSDPRFGREATPEGTEIFRAKLSPSQIETIKSKLAPHLNSAVMDAAYTDDELSNAGPQSISDLLENDLRNPFAQRAAQRILAMKRAEGIKNSPAARAATILLLTENDAMRTLGANAAVMVPTTFRTAFHEFHEKIDQLPGGRQFAQMMRGANDVQALCDVAGREAEQYAAIIFETLDAIPVGDIEAFSRTFSEPSNVEHVSSRLATQDILSPLIKSQKAFEDAICTYARNLQNGQSHFGQIIKKPTGELEAIGVEDLKTIQTSASEFTRHGDLQNFWPNIKWATRLPLGQFIQAQMAKSDDDGTDGVTADVHTVNALEMQASFHIALTNEILRLFGIVQRQYKADKARRDIASGMVIELLMINMHFMNVLEERNDIMKTYADAIKESPRTLMANSNNVSAFVALAHITLARHAKTSHAKKLALTILNGAFGVGENESQTY